MNIFNWPVLTVKAPVYKFVLSQMKLRGSRALF